MKYVLLTLVLFISSIISVNAALVRVNIAEDINVDLRPSTEINGNLLVTEFDFRNSGSVTYYTRARLDLMEDDKIIFTGWSERRLVTPGETQSYEVFWPMKTGEYTPRLRIYHGNEIKELFLEEQKYEESQTESIFEVSQIRVYQDRITFFIKSSRQVDNVIVVPHNYPLGWVIEQKEVGEMQENEFKKIILGYSVPQYTDIEINFIIVSADGKYMTIAKEKLDKEENSVELIDNFVDWLTISIRSIFG